MEVCVKSPSIAMWVCLLKHGAQINSLVKKILCQQVLKEPHTLGLLWTVHTKLVNLAISLKTVKLVHAFN